MKFSSLSDDFEVSEFRDAVTKVVFWSEKHLNEDGISVQMSKS
jgi:hypothetical protein